MNEPYRPQQPGAPRPEQPPFQSTGQVVRVWTKGRVIPLFGSACVLVALVFVVWLSIGHDIRDFINVEVILFVFFVFGVALAFRRKATLTSQQLIVRQLFRTRVLPLREIAEIYEHRKNAFTPNRVVIHLTDRRFCSTMSFGVSPREAIVMIAKAAKAAGSPIDL